MDETAQDVPFAPRQGSLWARARQRGYGSNLASSLSWLAYGGMNTFPFYEPEGS